MYIKSILWILLFISVQEVSPQDHDDYYYDEETESLKCSTTESIRGGHVTYSQGGLEGSVLTYHCSQGQYPFPVSHRHCTEGEWSLMRSANGRPVSRAICKDVLCPAQLQLDHGDIWPRDQWLRVGMTQNFSCQEGFTLYGSAQRNCTLSGDWTGTSPVCDNHADDCNDPGVPPGAQRSAGRFHTGEKVIYRCQTGLDLLGSAERVCLENKEWSGSTPRCQGPNTFDSPSMVAEAMAGSLAGVMDVLTPESKKKAGRVSYGRTIRVAEGSRINVYILLDTSGSIREQEFERSRNATIALIEKLDSYEVQLKFHVLSFASEAIDIVDIRDSDASGDIDNVIWKLMEFDYSSHGSKTGTNLHAALHRVSELINFLKQSSAKNHFNETQNIIIIETDGFSNTGNKPQIALARIRNLLGYRNTSPDHTDESLLDVYVFGIGEEVKKDQLNALASQKRNEMHVFILKDFKTLGQVFNSIISDKSVTMCGVAQEATSDEKSTTVFPNPWHVTLQMTSDSCFGSIVSQNWVLTAAHCFVRTSKDPVRQKPLIQHGEGTVSSQNVIIHPKYNIRALKTRNVSEFYDYDVALVQVAKSIPLSWKARPICLPCTVPASRAMKKVNATCQQHRKELLPHTETSAFFIHKNLRRKQTHIHTESQRPSCVEKARQVLNEPTNVTLDEYIPDRLLCSGGSSKYQDAIVCKGDSGGSLFLQKKKRYFQVGVVSFGTINVCDLSNPEMRRYSSDRPPPDARDFHIDLFKIMPWLKQHLGAEIQFLPEFD
ncbi:complement C2 [Micropterus dolomieu]|uniref:complement C2 n=1 Tax=Micropterus dolomieu TaxID=147949 RepID=UPI001E8CCCBC|nr:complement C2 [Micropterus dolomieu]